MAAFQAAQNELGQSLGRLLVSFEAYPQLKSDENFLTLQSQLEGTENRIAVARRDYNEAVRDYNTRIRTFPEMVGAKRSEEHTSELQSLMRISYAVFCLKIKTRTTENHQTLHNTS